MSNLIVQPVEQIRLEVPSLTQMCNDLGILDRSGHFGTRLSDGNFLVRGVNAIRVPLDPEDLFTNSR